jgi:serine/threonine protein kinase
MSRSFTPDRANGEPKHIGRYRILGRIGQGAMGVVFGAFDETMGREVAIKVMATDVESDPEMRERFYREARVTGQLVHPNIVTVFDLGEEGGRPYLVMERLHGAPLVDLLSRTAPVPLDLKLDLMLQMCDGLQAAHERGIVHRDLKPSNVFVQREGGLKILDFGLAQLAASTLTASGLLVGTPEYMSPEQAQGLDIDRRSDIFSAASVCYFITTGRPPFQSTDLAALLHEVAHRPPAAIAEREAPSALTRVLMKALAKMPDERHQSAAHLRAEIEQVREMKEGERFRMARAALDRYRQIDALIGERRELGRRLKVPNVEDDCDQSAVRLAQRFPQFARLESDGVLMAPIDSDVASGALAELQNWHNAELAAVAVLRTAIGDPPEGPGSSPEPAGATADRPRDVDARGGRR